MPEIPYEQLFDIAQDAMLLMRIPDGQILYANQAAVDLYGYSRPELLQLTIHDLRAPETQEEIPAQLQQAYTEGVTLETLHIRKGGSTIPVEVHSRGMDLDGQAIAFSTIRDITRRRKAEQALQLSEQKYRAFVQQSTAGVALIDETGKIIEWNRAQEAIAGVPREAVLGRQVWDVQTSLGPPSRPAAERREQGKALVTRLLAGEHVPSLDEPIEVTIVRPDGTSAVIQQTIFPIKTPLGYRLGSVATDITEHKLAMQALREKARLEEQLSKIAEMAPGGLCTLKYCPDGSMFIPYASPVWEEIHGIKVEDVKSNLGALMNAIHPDDRERIFHSLVVSARKMLPWIEEMRVIHPTKGEIWVEGRTSPLLESDGSIVWYGFITDITARKRASEEIKQTSQWLEKTQRLANVGGWCFDMVARKGWCSPETRQIYGLDQEEFSIDSDYIRTVPLPEYQEQLTRGIAALVYEGAKYDVEYRIFNRLDGTIRDIHAVAEFDPESRRVFGALQDITAPKQAELALRELHSETSRHLEQLKALREIDQSILSNLDLDHTLEVLLRKIIATLQVDAANVLLYNPQTQTLEMACQHGLPSHRWRGMVRLDNSHAGRVALLRQMDFVPDLSQLDDTLTQKIRDDGETFISYVGMPLVAKGELEGVLQLFHRTHLEPDGDWFSFLAALADQAAIAIHSARLFTEQQQTNARLTQAYDDTIDGWSHALDLRDKETEGHSQRVTDLTLALVKRLGIPDQALVHIRRGAKLHDIGKMGIPDKILLKPGPLSSDEWETMRMHPAYAVALLSRIKFLAPALEIPRYHHERWDGTGYPMRLKGEDIPLSARIFAVVDVWDALTSDRPYRHAWSKDKALDYIRDQSGKMFDPAVVEAFLDIVAERHLAD
jgi:PAS domain S-box-containing protein